MTDIIRTPPTESGEPRRKGTVRSFVSELVDGSEISPCPDCAHWHARVEDQADPSEGCPALYLREWHEIDCPCWGEE